MKKTRIGSLVISFLYLVVFNITSSCKPVQNLEKEEQGHGIIIRFDRNNFFLFPVNEYDKDLSLEENLRNLKLEEGLFISGMTDTQYSFILSKCQYLKRTDTGPDFAEYLQTALFLPVEIKYLKKMELNSTFYRKSKRTFKERIYLENDLVVKIKFNYLEVDILNIHSFL